MNGFSKTEQELWDNWETCFRCLHIILQKYGPTPITQEEVKNFLDKKEQARLEQYQDPVKGTLIVQAIFEEEVPNG